MAVRSLFRPGNLGTGLQGWWKMDEVSGQRNDSSGNARHLTDNNTVGSITKDYWHTGSRSADFDSGASEYLTGGDILDMNGSSMSVAVRLRPDAVASHYIVAKGTGGSTGYTFFINAGGNLEVYIEGTTTASTTALVAGRYYHVGFTYDYSTKIVCIYINGNLDKIASNAGVISNVADSFTVGTRPNTPPATSYDGRMEDLAIWNVCLTPIQMKSLAFGQDLTLYSFRPNNSSLTTPTRYYPLNEAVLSGFRNNFVGIAHTMTANGNAQLDTAQSKFGSSASGLFDGASDYVSTTVSNAVRFEGGNFVIDLNARFSDVGSARGLFGHGTDGSNYITFFYDGGGNLQFQSFGGGGSTIAITRSWTPSINTWYHIAVVRSGTNLYLFVDGVMLGAAEAISGLIGRFTGTVNIGGDSINTRWMNGWIDEFRISKGTDRGWTTNFTAPSVAHTSDSFTSLLLHMDGSDASTTFTDSSTGFYSPLTDAGSTGAGKGYIEGVSAFLETTNVDYFTLDDHTDLELGSGSFSVVLRFFMASSNDNSGILAKGQSDSNRSWELGITTGGNLRFRYTTTGNDADKVTHTPSTVATGLQVGVWHHIAYVRDGNTGTFYVNGVADATTINFAGATFFNGTQPLWVGRSADLGSQSGNSIEDFALYKGTALSAANIASIACGLDINEQALVSYFKCDEASGNLIDTKSGKTFTQNGTIGQVAGKVGNARDLESGSSEYFSRTDDNDYDEPFSTILLWAKHDAAGTEEYYFSKEATPNNHYFMYKNNVNAYSFQVGNGSTGASSSIAAATATNWNHVGGRVDGARINAILNGLTYDPQTLLGGFAGSAIDFRFGSNDPAGNYLNGLIDEIVYFKRAAFDDEITAAWLKGLNAKEATSSEISSGGLADKMFALFD